VLSGSHNGEALAKRHMVGDAQGDLGRLLAFSLVSWRALVVLALLLCPATQSLRVCRPSCSVDPHAAPGAPHLLDQGQAALCCSESMQCCSLGA